MPVSTAIAAVGAAVSASIAGTSLTTALVGALVSSAFGFASSKLLAQKASGGSSALSGGITKQIQQAITAHRIIYGKQRVSGPIILAESTNKDSTIKHKILHMVIVLAAHPCEKIGTVYLDDYPVPESFIGSNGEVGKGKFKGQVEKYSVSITNTSQAKIRIEGVTFDSGIVSNAGAAADALVTAVQAASGYGDVYTIDRVDSETNPNAAQLQIVAVDSSTSLSVSNVQATAVQKTQSKTNNLLIKKYLGADPQTADADLIDSVDRLDSNFRGNGMTYLYVRFKYSADLFPNGIPNISAEVYGKQLYDPRDAGTRWSDNPALVLRDYLTNSAYGRRVASSAVDDTNFGEVADLCEEYFTTKDVEVTVNSVSAADDEIFLAGDVNKFQTADRVQISSSGSVPAGLATSTNYYVIISNERKSNDSRPSIKLASSYANALSRTTIDITDAGSGTITVTKNAEPRYALNGVVETERPPIDILEEMISTFSGRMVHQGGLWRLYGGEYVAPTVSLDEDDLAGPISVQTRQPSRERFNAVKGNYVTPEYYGQATSYPNVINSTFETQDGGERVFANLDLPMVSRSNQAQRLATFALNKHRQQITVNLVCNLSAMQVQVGEMVQFSFDRYGWSNKVFEVVEWTLSTQDNVTTILLTLREFASDVYSFTSSTDETQPGDQPEITVPDGSPGDGPTGIVITSGTDELYVNQDGTVVSRIKIVWDEDDDNLISRYEIQYKRSTDTVYEPSQFVASDVNLLYVWDVEDGEDYDVRIRSVSPLGIVSAWVEETGHTVIGKTARPENVTGFSAQQNGNVVLFKWAQVGDKDVAGYELRFLEVI